MKTPIHTLMAFALLDATAAFATTSTPVMLDFGTKSYNDPAAPVTTPAHSEGVLGSADSTWFSWDTSKTDGTQIDDISSGVVDSRGTPVDVSIDLGNRKGGLNPDYNDQPQVVNGNTSNVGAAGQGVFCNGVFGDCLKGNGGNTSRNTFVRMSGFAAGRYLVYMVSRNTSNTGSSEFHCIRAGVGTGNTQLVTSWTDEDRLGFFRGTEPGTDDYRHKYWNTVDSNQWLSGINYRVQLVETTAESPDILVTCSYRSGDNGIPGPINALQIVPVTLSPTFTSSADNGGIALADTTFTANVANIASCRWDWGDGSSFMTDSASATHVYAGPGDYTVRLLVRDTDGNVGIAERLIPIGGNHTPVADAGQDFVGRLGDTLTLDASGSTDADGDTLTYSWRQISGTTVALSATDAATATYTPATEGTYVFEVTVTDPSGASDTATVTHTVYGLFRSTVMIDFGTRRPGSSPSATPAHTEGVLDENDTAWFSWDTSETNPLRDVSNGVVDSRGMPVGLVIDLGQNNSLVPNYAKQPNQTSGGSENDPDQACHGVFFNPVFGDFLVGDNAGYRTFVRLNGFVPGRYLVYMVSRNTFNKNPEGFYRIRAGVGTAETQIANDDWTDEDRLGFSRGTEPAADSDMHKYWGTIASDQWLSGVNYRVQTVETTASAPDILVVSAYEDGGDAKGGPINALQIVPLTLTASFTSSADSAGMAFATTTFTASAENAVSYRWDWGDGSTPETSASASATHVYTEPGAYTVRLVVRDASGNIGIVERELWFAGNHTPVADAGEFQSALLSNGLVMTLDASGSSDEDVGDTLSFAWTQLAGPVVALAGSATATPTYRPTVEGTYVFQVTVTDNGVPPESSSAVVTNKLAAPFREAVNIDFGTWEPPARGTATATNAPAFAVGDLDPSRDFWLRPSTGRLRDTYEAVDWFGPSYDADGNEIGLAIDFGISEGNVDGVPNWTVDWTKKPYEAKEGDQGRWGVYGTDLLRDFLFARSWDQRRPHVCLHGFQSGRYNVYVAARCLYSDNAVQAVRIATGDKNTVFEGNWQDSEKLAYYKDDRKELSNTWADGVTYISKQVIVDAAHPDILVATGFISGWGAGHGGAINLIQIVPQKDPATVVLIL